MSEIEDIGAGPRIRNLRAKVESMRNKVSDDVMLVAECAVSLHDCYLALHDGMNDWLADARLTLAKFDLLKLLKDGAADHQLPMAEIGARMCVTGANVTGLVDGLERQGLVRRANVPGDRRVVLAQLTEEGSALMDDILPKHHEHMKAMWVGLSQDETRELTQLLSKLTRSIEAPDSEGHSAPGRPEWRPE